MESSLVNEKFENLERMIAGMDKKIDSFVAKVSDMDEKQQEQKVKFAKLEEKYIFLEKEQSEIKRNNEKDLNIVHESIRNKTNEIKKMIKEGDSKTRWTISTVIAICMLGATIAVLFFK